MLFEDGKSSAIVDTIDPAAFRAILSRREGRQIVAGPVARFAVYRSPPFTKLLIDCDNHRVMITGPELIEPGVYTGAPQIELPYPYELAGPTRSRRSTLAGRPRSSGPAPRRR